MTDPQDLPPLAEVLALAFDEGLQSQLHTHTFRGRCDDRRAVKELAAPYDAELQRLREALAAKDRAFCTAPLLGLAPEFFAFCELEGEAPEIEFFTTAEEASKAADAFLERAQECLAEGLTEEPEIAYGRIYARCETSNGPAPDEADYDETWSFELEPRLTAEAENERLLARVAELEAKNIGLREELEKGCETFRKGFSIANDQAEHVTSLFLPVEAERDQLARKVAELEACRDALNSANIEVGIEKERLRAELAPYRELAREAKVVLDGIDYGSMAGLTLERWVQRLAAHHKEE
jgi:hypothetical protein